MKLSKDTGVTRISYCLNGVCGFDRVYYSAKTLDTGTIDIDEWTGQPQLIQREYRRLCVQLI